VTESRLSIHLSDALATERFGARLGPLLAGGMVVTLRGELGSGKTTLVRGVLRARGVEGPIKSPTYTLVEHYPVSSLYFYHFDFYRLASSDEWDDTGFAEYFRRDSVGLVEWPERVAGLLAAPDLALSLSHPPDGGRDLRVEAYTEEGERCVTALARDLPTTR
jgi:tRNA threonylcarbamoyladenosine biosynthesis protein TsaE